MSDYAKLVRIFPELRDSLLEDCSLLVNCWMFCYLIRFLPLAWLEPLLDFDKGELMEEPSFQQIEKMHSFNVFKIKNESLRKVLMDFELQILEESEDMRSGLGLLIQTLLKQNNKGKTHNNEAQININNKKKGIINLNLFKLNSDNFLLKTANRTKKILLKDPETNSQKNSEDSLSNSSSASKPHLLDVSDVSSDKFNSEKKKSFPDENSTLYKLILGLKSFEYLLNVFDVLENFENNFYSVELRQNLATFLLQCHYCEKLKTHKVFQNKIFNFPWKKLEIPISEKKNHPYLQDICHIIDGIVSDFKSLNNQQLNLKPNDISTFLIILFDFLLTLIVEIYSKIHNCSVNGRFQMKMDLQAIFTHMEKYLSYDEMTPIIEKFRCFVEVYWYNSQNDIINYIIENYDEFSFEMTKCFLFSNKLTEINGKLVLTDQQNKIINYASRKVFKKLHQDYLQEESLNSHFLFQILKQDIEELPSHFDETLKTFKKLLLKPSTII